MIGSAVVTSKIGPGLDTATAMPVSNISKIEYDLAHEVCRIHHLLEGKPKITEVGLVGVTGIVTTTSGVTGSTVTFVIS